MGSCYVQELGCYGVATKAGSRCPHVRFVTLKLGSFYNCCLDCDAGWRGNECGGLVSLQCGPLGLGSVGNDWRRGEEPGGRYCFRSCFCCNFGAAAARERLIAYHFVWVPIIVDYYRRIFLFHTLCKHRGKFFVLTHLSYLIISLL